MTTTTSETLATTAATRTDDAESLSSTVVTATAPVNPNFMVFSKAKKLESRAQKRRPFTKSSMAITAAVSAKPDKMNQNPKKVFKKLERNYSQVVTSTLVNQKQEAKRTDNDRVTETLF